MKQLVTFDIDGTLVDSNGFDEELFAQAVQEVAGVEFDRTLKSYRHITDSGIVRDVLLQSGISDHRVGDGIKRRFVELIGAHLGEASCAVEEIPGARALLRRLQSVPHLAIAIATGGWRETAKLKLSSVGIDVGGIPLATASDAIARVDIMGIAEERAGSGEPFTHKTYFGDGPWDQQASAELGYSFIAVGTEVDHPIRFMDLVDQDAILSVLKG